MARVPFEVAGGSNSLFLCNGLSTVPVSADEVDLVSTCSPYDYNVAGRAEPGTYRSVTVLRDTLGQERTVEDPLEVVPRP